MVYLVAGLLVFLGVHSLRLIAPEWRDRKVASMSANSWKGAYALVALAGFALLIWGYGLARQQPTFLWNPIVGMRHLASLLMLVASVLLVATYVPRNHLKAALHHPMLLATKVWALAHLLANNTLADVLLFGSFLVWAIVVYAASRRRDRTQGVVYAKGTALGTAITLVVGAGVWVAFALLHGRVIGVRVFG